MMMAMPVRHTATPSQSVFVGRTLSTNISQTMATGHADIDAAVGRVDPPSRRGVQREQPREQGQTPGRRQEQPGRTVLLQPEIRQVATDDLSHGGGNEEEQRLEDFHPDIVEPAPNLKPHEVRCRWMSRRFAHRASARTWSPAERRAYVRCGNQRQVSPPGRLEPTSGRDSSPETCPSQLRSGEIFERAGKDGLWSSRANAGIRFVA